MSKLSVACCLYHLFHVITNSSSLIEYMFEFNRKGFLAHILNDTSNTTDRVFAIIPKLPEILKRNLQGL